MTVTTTAINGSLHDRSALTPMCDARWGTLCARLCCFRRIDTAGMLLSLLFRQLYRNFLKALTTQVYKLIDSKKMSATPISELINHRRITCGFKYAFSTGNWGAQKGSSQSGVAQILSRMTTVSAVANLRRINTPINRIAHMLLAATVNRSRV